MSTKHDSTIDMADILIVDDESANLKLLSDILGRQGYHVRPANSPRLAIDSALGKPPDLILLDIRMPDMDGLEVCAALKQDERTHDVPILFISALQDTQDKVRAFEAGGVDFITKPFQEEEVLARVQTHLKLRSMQRSQEELVAERTAKLTESEMLFSTILSATHDAALLFDEKGTIIDCNASFLANLGATKEETIGSCIFDRFAEDETDQRMVWINKAMEKGKPVRFEDYIGRSDKYFQSTLFPLAADKDERRRVLMMAQEITERKKAEMELKKNRDYLQHLINSIPDAVFSVKLPERTIEWARDSYNVLGFNLDEFIGEKTERLYGSVEEYQAVGNLMSTAIRNHEDGFITEAKVKKRNGETIPAEINTTIYREEGEPVRAISLVRDISFRKKAREALEASKTQLEQARKEAMGLRLEMAHLNRVMTMNELAASFAHEINQPLGAIVNNASVAKIMNSQSAEAREELSEILEDIAGDAQRAGQIIRKIRGVMKKGDSFFAPLDVNLLLDDVLVLYQNSFSLDHVSVVMEKDPDLVPVKGDQLRLQQVLMNLITNALDAMVNSRQKVLTVKTGPSEGMVRVSVSDTGSGVGLGDMDQIFDPFYTTKGDGMGIGLRLCKSIIEEHGGRIWVENNRDAGATFYFTLETFSEGDDHGHA